MDKNQAMLDYLLECPIIKDNPLFFNFTDAKDEANQIVTESSDRALSKPYIDGSVQKQYIFSLICYKAISYNPVVKMPSYSDENMENLATVQSIIDWIDEQADKRVFPNFGSDCDIDDMSPLALDPSINGIDTTVDPPLAMYGIGVKVTYIDNTKKLWR